MKASDYPHNSRNTPGDTFDWLEEPSAAPVVSPDVASTDERWESTTGDVTVASASLGARIHPDGSVTTRYKSDIHEGL